MLVKSKEKRSHSAIDAISLGGNELDENSIPLVVSRCIRESGLVGEAGFGQLLSLMKIRRLAPGDLLIREGTLGKSIFIVLSGTVVIWSELYESEIGELGVGNVLGEIGGLLDVPRTMTVRARGQGCTVGVLTREDVFHVPGLPQTLLGIAKKRLEADEVRDQDVLASCPKKLKSLVSQYEEMFGEVPSPSGKFIKRTDKALLLLSDKKKHFCILQGEVRVRKALSGEYLYRRYCAGEQGEVEPDGPLIYQAVGQTSIYFNPDSGRVEEDPDRLILHMESRDTFGAATEQAPRLNQIVSSSAGSKQRRSSIAVWSDESFLRPIIHQGVSLESKRRQSAACPIKEIGDVIGLMEHMGIPAELHRNRILKTSAEGWFELSLEPVNQYFDAELLDAILEFTGSSLTSLNLSDCWNLTDAGLAKVMRTCMNLRALILNNCWSVTETGFIVALQGAPLGLQRLEVKGCAGLTSGALEHLTKLRLKHVDLSFCKNIDGSAWKSLRQMPLESLALRRCSKISGEVMLASLEGTIFENLQNVDLSDCSFLSDSAITRLVSCCPRLSHLNISFCQDLDVQFFERLAQTNPSRSLRELEVEHCHNFFTDATVEGIIATWPGLTKLNARGCSNMTNASIQALAQLQQLKYVDLSCCPHVDPLLLTKTALVRAWILINPPNLFG